MHPTPHAVTNRNQGVVNQKGDAGKIEELNTQVRISCKNWCHCVVWEWKPEGIYYCSVLSVLMYLFHG
jgi:hypothetical protein